MARCCHANCPEGRLYLHEERLYCIWHLPLDEVPLLAQTLLTRVRCRLLRAELEQWRHAVRQLRGGPATPGNRPPSEGP